MLLLEESSLQKTNEPQKGSTKPVIIWDEYLLPLLVYKGGLLLNGYGALILQWQAPKPSLVGVHDSKAPTGLHPRQLQLQDLGLRAADPMKMSFLQ